MFRGGQDLAGHLPQAIRKCFSRVHTLSGEELELHVLDSGHDDYYAHPGSWTDVSAASLTYDWSLVDLLPTFIDPFLYLLALGFGLGTYVAHINGIPYKDFIAPGLIASWRPRSMVASCVRLHYKAQTRVRPQEFAGC